MSEPTAQRLGAGAEFEMIRRIQARLGTSASGLGDDAAILAAQGPLCVSTDASIEDVHFRRGWLSPAEIGWRATVAALSDLCAMGARPLALLVAMVVPSSWDSDVEAITEGVKSAADGASAKVIGGDISRGANLGLIVTVIGATETPIGRDGAQVGDVIAVTGALGGPLLALRALESGSEPSCASRERFAHPVLRLEIASRLASIGAHAAIDISDGLAADLGHIAAASGVTIELDLDRIPHVADSTTWDAAISGEEYELAIALPPDADIDAIARATSTSLTVVGGVVAGHRRVVAREHGRVVDLPSGHDHLSP